ncbi:HotDog domain-containing protein [Hypoxylon sp. NC1633]|nr:HotDog domain-containing protein [Hypoxylon sp. NC1633]
MSEAMIPTSKSSDLDHFQSIPWCAQHLQGPRITTLTPDCRTAKSDGRNALYSTTLKTPETILAMLQVYEEPVSPMEPVDCVKTFLTLGPGLDGHPGVCHGGIVTTILDEVAAHPINVSKERGFIPRRPYMTGYLNTNYLRPVFTRTTILAQARILKIEGRKFLVEAWIEDSVGEILARAEVLYVQLKGSL